MKGKKYLLSHDLYTVYPDIKTDIVCHARINRVEIVSKKLENIEFRKNCLENELAFLLNQVESYENRYKLPPVSISEAIQFRLHQAGMQQVDACRITGISPNRMSEYISGKRCPGKKHATALHMGLGIPLQAFFQ